MIFINKSAVSIVVHRWKALTAPRPGTTARSQRPESGKVAWPSPKDVSRPFTNLIILVACSTGRGEYVATIDSASHIRYDTESTISSAAHPSSIDSRFGPRPFTFTWTGHAREGYVEGN